ncbi:hypothetical protein AYI70_g7529 [Smittium culicis]|uniref:Uncharacterized protein n=1 Tax=Smittium culicis TaxID=133412 RepID=A0A1R1WZJ4_9FUNG|nr:hypothetical protein AYI70_g11964 [Smittium culicis]OMJ15032.1 hypothetical protein AYI70_g7529 [Smittium culicis]
MDQDDTNQVPVSQETFNKLTEMFRKLLIEKERNPEPEDPDVTTRVPLTDLAVYSGLIEALPSIEEDFFDTPLTEKEWKETIHSCHRTSSVVKKVDADPHGIQIALAQATRLIDYYVYRIIQDNPQANSEDTHIFFANTMRVLLADIAATVTQGRSDNLHKGMELPGKLQKLIEPKAKLLMEQEKHDVLISTKNPEERSRVRKPFRVRQQYNTQNSSRSKIYQAQTMEAATTPATVNNPPTHNWFPKIVEKGFQIPFTKLELPSKYSEENRKRLERFDKESAAAPNETSDGSTTTETSPNTAQEENGSRCTRSPDNRSCVTIDQESDQGSEDTRSGILQQSFRSTKEERRTQTSLGLEETESPCTGVELKNEVTLVNLPTDPQKRLHEVTGSRKCIYAHSNPRILQEAPPLLLEWESIPVQSASVRTITESLRIYKDSSPDSDMDENTRNPNICISGRIIDPGKIE